MYFGASSHIYYKLSYLELILSVVKLAAVLSIPCFLSIL